MTDPAAVAARGVAITPDEHLAAGMRGATRAQILDHVFRGIESHFEADRAGEVDAVVRWRITGRADGDSDRYDLEIRDGRCRVAHELAEHPRVTLTLDGVDFLKLVTGNVDGPDLLLRRRLRITGDTAFAARIADLFRIPTPR
jgi:predicted lipid carrier protein YhbT